MRSQRTPGQAPPRRVNKKCRTCRTSYPAGSLVAGQCADCAGLVALPLRGERVRFLPGLTPGSAGGAA